MSCLFPSADERVEDRKPPSPRRCLDTLPFSLELTFRQKVNEPLPTTTAGPRVSRVARQGPAPPQLRAFTRPGGAGGSAGFAGRGGASPPSTCPKRRRGPEWGRVEDGRSVGSGSGDANTPRASEPHDSAVGTVWGALGTEGTSTRSCVDDVRGPPGTPRSDARPHRAALAPGPRGSPGASVPADGVPRSALIASRPTCVSRVGLSSFSSLTRVPARGRPPRGVGSRPAVGVCFGARVDAPAAAVGDRHDDVSVSPRGLPASVPVRRASCLWLHRNCHTLPTA